MDSTSTSWRTSVSRGDEVVLQVLWLIVGGVVRQLDPAVDGVHPVGVVLSLGMHPVADVLTGGHSSGKVSPLRGVKGEGDD